ncbi:hypothetical protein LTS18_014442 [Coniosporium uncinatum]|uniref:Uncharacterized protein n=1 Tax=Coniosporium uncinatum TaxID=93489 RepID=A0ACC3D8W7_9PEZI|nr:hypothetical protein LTS18_014442 [Coniosporium uncinatum]
MALWTKHLKWTPERVKEFLVDVEKDLKDPKTHYYWIVHIFYAQKPEVSNAST